MDAIGHGTGSIVALLPFLVKGAMSLSVLRAMRDRGYDVTLCYFHSEVYGYTRDPAADFKADGRLLDFSEAEDKACLTTLDNIVTERNVGLVLQIGAPCAYAILPYLKERHPGLRVVDTMYNEVGHAVDHFLYEACFDAVIVESHHMRRFIERCSGKITPNVIVVESGIDLLHFTPFSAGPPKGGLVLGYIGRMSPEKNPLAFVTMAKRMVHDQPNLTFLMFGEGGISEDVKANIGASELGDRIRFKGYVTDQRDALAQIDVLVVPSKLDGRPNIIMEANACGRPVIAAPVGGIPELIENGRNGYLLAPDAFAELSMILRAWEINPQVLAALSASSRDTALSRFDRRRMLDRYDAVFSSFLSC